MKNTISMRIKQYLSDHKKRKRLVLMLCALSICVGAGVYGLMTIPAISKEVSNPLIQTTSHYALYGETIQLEVSATAESQNPQTVFLLATQEMGGGISPEYEFNDNNETYLTAKSGNTITLHREMEEDGTIQYWFALPANTTEKFTLNCVSAQLPSEESQAPENATGESEAPASQDESTSSESEDPVFQEESTSSESEAPVSQDESTSSQSEASISQDESTSFQSETPVPQDESTSSESAVPVPQEESIAPESEAPVPQNEGIIPENSTPTPEDESTSLENIVPLSQDESLSPESVVPLSLNAAASSGSLVPVPLNEIHSDNQFVPVWANDVNSPASVVSVSQEESVSSGSEGGETSGTPLPPVPDVNEATPTPTPSAPGYFTIASSSGATYEEALAALQNAKSTTLSWVLTKEELKVAQENESEEEMQVQNDGVGDPRGPVDYTTEIEIWWDVAGTHQTAINDVSNSQEVLDVILTTSVSCSSGKTYKAGDYSFAVPQNLFPYRDTDGNPANNKTQYSAQLDSTVMTIVSKREYQNGATGTTPFYYEYDSDNLQYVITNYSDISACNYTMQFDYKVRRPETVDGTNVSVQIPLTASYTENGVKIDDNKISNTITFSENTGIQITRIDKKGANTSGVDNQPEDNEILSNGRLHAWPGNFGPKPSDFDSGNYRWFVYTVDFGVSGNQPYTATLTDTPENGGIVYAVGVTSYTPGTLTSIPIALKDVSTRETASGDFSATGGTTPSGSYKRNAYQYTGLAYNGDGSANMTLTAYPEGGNNVIGAPTVGSVKKFTTGTNGESYWHYADETINSKWDTFVVVVKYPIAATQMKNVATVTVTPVDGDAPSTLQDEVISVWKPYKFAYPDGINGIIKRFPPASSNPEDSNDNYAIYNGGLEFLKMGQDVEYKGSNNGVIRHFTVSSFIQQYGDVDSLDVELGDDFLVLSDDTNAQYGYTRLTANEYTFTGLYGDSSYNAAGGYIWKYNETLGMPVAYTAEELADKIQLWAKVNGVWQQIPLPAFTNKRPDAALASDYFYYLTPEQAATISFPEGTTDVKFKFVGLTASTYVSWTFCPSIRLKTEAGSYLNTYIQNHPNDDNMEILNFCYQRVFSTKDGVTTWDNSNVSYEKNYDWGSADTGNLNELFKVEDGRDYGHAVLRDVSWLILRDIKWTSNTWKKVGMKQSGVATGVAVFENTAGSAEFAANFFGAGAQIKKSEIPQVFQDLYSNYNSMVSYDLLPLGMHLYRPDSTEFGITFADAAGNTAEVKAADSSSYSVISNYKGSGRDLVIFHYSMQTGKINMTTQANTTLAYEEGIVPDFFPTTDVKGPNLLVGYSVRYYTYSTIRDLKRLQENERTNVIAYQYESKSPVLGTGYPDDGVWKTDAQNHDLTFYTGKTENVPLLNDLRGDGVIANVKDTQYAIRPYPVAELSTQANEVRKLVKAATEDDSYYDELTEVPLGQNYNFKITYSNGEGDTKNLVLFDFIENNYGTNHYWQGSLLSVDLSNFTALGVKPIVYYIDEQANIPANPDDYPSKQFYHGETLPAGWKLGSAVSSTGIWTAPAGTKAIAVDVSRTDADGEYWYSGDAANYMVLTMKAPSAMPADEAAVYSYNATGYKSQYRVELTDEFTEKHNNGSLVKVSLMDDGAQFVDVTLNGTKTESGTGIPTTPVTYQFKLEAITAGAPMPSPATVDGTVAAGFAFSAIRFTQAGTYEYTLSEVAGTSTVCAYDTATYKITVVVNADFTTTVTCKRSNEASSFTLGEKAITFNNVYIGPWTAKLAMTKVVNGSGYSSTDTFRVNIKPLDGAANLGTTAYDIKPGQTVTTANISGDAPGTNVYEIKETAVGEPLPNYTYDTNTYYGAIIVTKTATGFSVSVKYYKNYNAETKALSNEVTPNNNGVPITNTYGKPDDYELPSTGGTGTLPICIAATVLLSISFVFIMWHKKKKREGDNV